MLTHIFQIYVFLTITALTSSVVTNICMDGASFLQKVNAKSNDLLAGLLMPVYIPYRLCCYIFNNWEEIVTYLCGTIVPVVERVGRLLTRFLRDVIVPIVKNVGHLIKHLYNLVEWIFTTFIVTPIEWILDTFVVVPFEWILTHVRVLIDWFGGKFLLFLKQLIDYVDCILQVLRSVCVILLDLWENIVVILSNVLRWFCNNVFGVLQFIWENIVTPLFDVLQFIWEHTVVALLNVLQWFGEKVLDVLRFVWDNTVMRVLNMLRWVWNNVMDGLLRLLELLDMFVFNVLQPLWNRLELLLDNVLDICNIFFTKLYHAVINTFSKVWDILHWGWTMFVDYVGYPMLCICRNVWNVLVSTLARLWLSICHPIALVWTSVVSTFDVIYLSIVYSCNNVFDTVTMIYNKFFQ